MDASRELATRTTEDVQAEGPAPPELPKFSQRRIGRYVLEARLGSGGMGLVYYAHDVELDRLLAIKLLQHTHELRSSSGRARFQREAQAMAKLSHPNVVQVYDAGEHEGQVFVAMELVRGETLREWLEPAAGEARARRPRPWREVLAIFLQAGEGLAAAHAVGIVHRDFKPDNVFLGEDGRVRVGDFGLAHWANDGAAAVAPADASSSLADATVSGTLTLPGSRIGTPAYMSPEQHALAPTDARSDQFSFCVALFEALYGRRPFAGQTLHELGAQVRGGEVVVPPGVRVPGWLRRAVLRGLSVRPDDRHVSMRALLTELGRGQARARARVLLAGLTALACAGLLWFAWHRGDVARRVAGCEATGAALDVAWNATAREQVREALVGTGLSYAALTAEKVAPWLDRQVTAWRAERTEACLDREVHGRLDVEAYERVAWCFDERAIELRSLVERLRGGDPAFVPLAVAAAAGLESVGRCRDVDLLRRLPLPPAAGRDEVRAIRELLAQGRQSRDAGRFEAALATFEQALRRARTLGWPPLVAEAQLRMAGLLERMDRIGEAEALFVDGYFEAVRAGARHLAGDAATSLISLIGASRARPDEGRLWARLAEVELAALGEPEDSLRSAGLIGTAAHLEFKAGALERAREMAARTQAIFERDLGADHPRVLSGLNRIARIDMAQGRYAAVFETFQRLVRIAEEQLGPDHPETLRYRVNLGATYYQYGHYEEARTLLTAALPGLERVNGRDSGDIAGTLVNLALVHGALGDDGAARPLLERALQIDERTLGADHPEVATSMMSLAMTLLRLGDYDGAKARIDRALALQEPKLGPEHPIVAQLLRGRGVIEAAIGDLAAARATYERALAIGARGDGRESPEHAESLRGLGEALLGLGEPAAAREQLERARAIVAKARGEEHPEVAFLMVGLAQARAAEGALDEAHGLAARAVELLDRSPAGRAGLPQALAELAAIELARGRASEADGLISRALAPDGAAPPARSAELRFTLARALWDAPAGAGRDRTRARALAEEALDGYRSVPSLSRLAARVERWLLERRRSG